MHPLRRAFQGAAGPAGYDRRIDKLAHDWSGGALIHWRGALVGLVAVLVAAASLLDTLLQRGSDGLFNDFYDYWLAARVIGAGGNPYDTAAMTAAAGHAGLHFTLGTGYSYPLLFGYVCLPLTVLPPGPAAIVFSALSLLALGVAVAILATPLGRLHIAELLLLGALAGGLTPISGSLYFGQANLVLLPLLALAWRGVARPLTLGFTTAVKLYPAAALAAIAAGGRRSLGLLGATVSAMLVLTVVPNLLMHTATGSGPAALLQADPFWTNQSVNGLLSRLSMSSEFTQPPLPGLPVAPIEIILLLLLGGGAMAVMVLRKGRPWAGSLSLALAFAVVAAPKNSLWNYAPLLLVVFFCWPLVRRSVPALAVLLTGLALVELQAVVDYFRHTFYTSPGLTWLSSLALYGALLLVALNAYLVLKAGDVAAPDTEPRVVALKAAA
jgi:hypothetical protein